MGTRKSFQDNRSKTLTIAVQAAHLKKMFPDSTLTLAANSRLTWVGQLLPSELSQRYTVKIKYRLKERPVVTVVQPELYVPKDKSLPHVFSGNELCLFRYKYFEWDSSMIIAKTIVAWASLWLLYSEIWLATGQWCGSNQEHPGADTLKEDEQAAEEVEA